MMPKEIPVILIGILILICGCEKTNLKNLRTSPKSPG